MDGAISGERMRSAPRGAKEIVAGNAPNVEGCAANLVGAFDVALRAGGNVR